MVVSSTPRHERAPNSQVTHVASGDIAKNRIVAYNMDIPNKSGL
jgi:hypothetical protein